jgi:murein DD-endopeptidase MepM/ murein hydrolase activator NlpD
VATSLITEYRRARVDWPFIDKIEKDKDLPARLLFAVGWRETRLQNIMGDKSQRDGEPSPRFHGFGVWQRDSDAFGVDRSYLKNVRKQATDAANLLGENFKIFGQWPAAIAAYNCGPGNVQTALAQKLPVDHFTTGGDYSKDVIATRKRLEKHDADPKQAAAPDPAVVPPPEKFRPGHVHDNFTLMGRRFKVWLKSNISKEGRVYTPGPRFSKFDRENVKKVQLLMGDEPDGWFGQSQWTKLLNHDPPKQPPHVDASPVAGLRVTQGFGVKNSMYAAGEHTGVDFGNSGDFTIRCVRPGTVVVKSFDSDGWGHYVIVQHDDKRFSWYCHLSHTAVAIGDEVTRGDRIGHMGQSGNADGIHLHYQESQDGFSYGQYVRPELLDL